MNYERIKSAIDRQFSDWMIAKPHWMVSGKEVCRVTMPLLEPNGDTIQVYLTEVNGRFVVEDGGHIAGLLYEASNGSPAGQYWDVVERQLYDSGMKKNSAAGRVYVETDEDGLRYWMTELAQLIAVLPHLLPQRKPPERTLDQGPESSGLFPGRRIAVEVADKLREAGFGYAVRHHEKAPGITQNKRQVDLSYTTPVAELGIGKTVYILTVDLDGRQALDQAGRKLSIANDLAWSVPAYSDRQVDVRMVYGIERPARENEPAVRLLEAAGERSLVSSYWWDDLVQQNKFMAAVEQDLPSLSELRGS